jgi:hypothetical protein
MGVAMMTFLHLYLKYTQPLFIQGLMGLKGLYEAKPVALYIFGKPAEGDLKRPFKQPPGIFGGMFIFDAPAFPCTIFFVSFLTLH